jgi:hypothetical protein
MMDHALTQMDSEEDDICDEDDPINDDMEVGGSCFHIRVERDTDNPRRKKVSNTRINSRKKAHSLQIDLPETILQRLKNIGWLDDAFELRTEALIQGTRYRAYANYRGEGPWYDFVIREFQLDQDLDYQSSVDDNNWYPAKLIGFYRLLPNADEDAPEFEVPSHCVQYQRLDSEIYSRRSFLQRSWLYEVTGGPSPCPLYRTAGSIKSNICVRGHIFAIKENPGFHKRNHSEEDKRILVLSDARKEWSHIFISDAMMSVGCNVSDEEDSNSDSEE